MSYIRICDRCNKQDAPAVSAGGAYGSKWSNITLMIPSHGNHPILLCDICTEKLYARLALSKEEVNPRQRILDILTDFVYEVACDAISNNAT